MEEECLHVEKWFQCLPFVNMSPFVNGISMCIFNDHYTKWPKISDGFMSETSAAGGSNMKESVSAPAVELYHLLEIMTALHFIP